MTDSLPPLVFEPRFVEKLWGGRKLETELGKKLPAEVPIGESWEIFDFPPGYVEGTDDWVSAVVAGGEHKGRSLHDLVTEHAELLLGKRVPVPTAVGGQFPLLIKFLDAKQDLSIQVHPTLEYTLEHEDAHLKTECWIILSHEPEAVLYKSLKRGTTKGQFEEALRSGHVADLIGTVSAKVGDCHFLPSGAVHALGAGTLVAEVQTPSDTTYRVFDFNRVDAHTGKPRKLHIEQAMKCINFEDPSTPAVTNTRNTALPLVDCAFFKTTSVKAAPHTVRPLPRGEMKIWMIVEGSVKLRWEKSVMTLRRGQTVLLPAVLPSGVMANFTAPTTYLETVLP